jgi:hypothetical protein
MANSQDFRPNASRQFNIRGTAGQTFTAVRYEHLKMFCGRYERKHVVVRRDYLHTLDGGRLHFVFFQAHTHTPSHKLPFADIHIHTRSLGWMTVYHDC